MSVWNFLGQALGLGYEVRKDMHLTGAQREANRFNASEAAKQRQFSSAEAEAARAWQEHMYTEYESPQALMRQAKEAGINPAAVYGDALGGSAPSSSAPSGSAASSVTPSGGDVVGMVQALTNIKLAQADIKYKEQLGKESASKILVNNAQSEKLFNEASKLVSDKNYIEESIGLLRQQIAESVKRVEESDSRINLNSAQVDKLYSGISVDNAEIAYKGALTLLTEAQRTGQLSQNDLLKWRADVADAWGVDPATASPLVQGVLSLLANKADIPNGIVSDIVDYLGDPKGGKPWYHMRGFNR